MRPQIADEISIAPPHAARRLVLMALEEWDAWQGALREWMRRRLWEAQQSGGRGE